MIDLVGSGWKNQYFILIIFILYIILIFIIFILIILIFIIFILLENNVHLANQFRSLAIYKLFIAK